MESLAKGGEGSLGFNPHLVGNVYLGQVSSALLLCFVIKLLCNRTRATNLLVRSKFVKVLSLVGVQSFCFYLNHITLKPLIAGYVFREYLLARLVTPMDV